VLQFGGGFQFGGLQYGGGRLYLLIFPLICSFSLWSGISNFTAIFPFMFSQSICGREQTWASRATELLVVWASNSLNRHFGVTGRVSGEVSCLWWGRVSGVFGGVAFSAGSRFRRGRVFGRVVLLDGSRFWTGHVTRLLGWTVRFGMSGEFIQSHRSELQHRASLASSQRRRMRVSDGSSSKQTRSTRQRQPSFATLISGIII